ncbi:MAG: hypothetical protein EOO60_05480 [Hymenobacter sp.]|nr:MAG: hypothetical protein EOO60_05480 [Hymenobacter sp.]
MQPHILTIPDDESYRKLVRLAEAIGLQVDADGLVSKQGEAVALPVIRPVLSEAERQQHLAVIARDGSGQSIPDSSAWQREVRQDRRLPGRD